LFNLTLQFYTKQKQQSRKKNVNSKEFPLTLKTYNTLSRINVEEGKAEINRK